MATKGGILTVGISLALLSLCYAVPSLELRGIKRDLKREIEPPDGGVCILLEYVSGSISSSCDLDKAAVSVVCSSACDSLYSAFVSCYGTNFTRYYYNETCPNGYQGIAAHATFSCHLLLAAALVAAIMKIVG